MRDLIERPWGPWPGVQVSRWQSKWAHAALNALLLAGLALVFCPFLPLTAMWLDTGLHLCGLGGLPGGLGWLTAELLAAVTLVSCLGAVLVWLALRLEAHASAVVCREVRRWLDAGGFALLGVRDGDEGDGPGE